MLWIIVLRFRGTTMIYYWNCHTVYRIQVLLLRDTFSLTSHNVTNFSSLFTYYQIKSKYLYRSLELYLRYDISYHCLLSIYYHFLNNILEKWDKLFDVESFDYLLTSVSHFIALTFENNIWCYLHVIAIL